MCQYCVRSLPVAPSTLCITADTVCVCVFVCVFALACYPTTQCILPMFIAHQFNLWGGNAYMCQDCFRSLPEIQSTLCITVDTVCVCVCVCVSVCVCHCLLTHPPLHIPDVHRPWLHPPCVSRRTLCVCVCLCVCLPLPATLPRNASSRCS